MNRGGPPSQQSVMQQMMAGGLPIPTPSGRSGMVAGAGGVIPPTLLEESRLPRFYHEAIQRCGAIPPHNMPNTALVYNMMVTSGLPRSMLSYIWSAVNRTMPGQLTRSEFFSCLALIALAQKGESLVALSNYSCLPVPVLQQTSVPAPAAPTPSPLIAFSQPQTRPSTTASKPSTSAMVTKPSVEPPKEKSFVPAALLPEPVKPEKTKVDLLGDLLTPSALTPSSSSISQTSTDSCSTFPTESFATMESFDSADLQKAPLEDRGSRIAEKCLTAILELFSEAQTFIQADPDIFEEVSSTEKGAEYMQALHSLSLVLRRLSKKKYVTLTSKVKLASEMWTVLSKLYKDKDEEEKTTGSNKCDICDSPVSDSVHYASHHYHPECANLWINFVDTRLP